MTMPFWDATIVYLGFDMSIFLLGYLVPFKLLRKKHRQRQLRGLIAR